ncbi:MAG: Spy/CpxP family protein refolding chaperone [Thermodesulfobacteriota bacterium]
MRLHKFFLYLMVLVFLGGLVAGCKPRADTMMAKAECMFIKMVDHTAKKLDLNEDQKAKLEGLKLEIHKNFQEGRMEKKEAFLKIKEEGMKENPDIEKMTGLFQDSTKAEAQRINRAFDLLLGFQSNLNDTQKKKLTQMISDWVKKWD